MVGGPKENIQGSRYRQRSKDLTKSSEQNKMENYENIRENTQNVGGKERATDTQLESEKGKNNGVEQMLKDINRLKK